MKKKSDVPSVYLCRKEGRSRRQIQADYLEIDCGEAGRFVVHLPEVTGRSLRVSAEKQTDDVALQVRNDAINAVSLSLSSPHSGAGLLGTARKVGSTLTLTVQRALTSDEKSLAPRKHFIRRWALMALLQRSVEVTVRLVGEAEGRALNHEYRGKDKATNVLTFVYDENIPAAQAEETVLRGDLVLCVPVVAREALEQGKTVEAHFAHLLVHGMLHLQGYDHDAVEMAETMEKLETEILEMLGYSDPYA